MTCLAEVVTSYSMLLSQAVAVQQRGEGGEGAAAMSDEEAQLLGFVPGLCAARNLKLQVRPGTSGGRSRGLITPPPHTH